MSRIKNNIFDDINLLKRMTNGDLPPKDPYKNLNGKKGQAMKTLDKEMLKELKEKSPLGRLALIGAMSQIATKKVDS